MTTAAMRRSIGMIAATALLVAGCSAGQGDPKVALTVGDVKVSTVEQVQQRLNELLATNQAAQDQARQRKLDVVSRGIVTQEALNQLTKQAAERAGIRLDEQLVEQSIPVLTGPQATQGDPFQAVVDAAFPAKEVARYRLMLVELGGRAIGRSSFEYDVAFLENFADAQKLAKQVADDPARSAQLMQAAPNPVRDPILNAKQGPADAESPDQLVSLATSPLFNLPAGSVVSTRLTGEQGGYIVFYLKSRQAAQPPAGFDASSVQPLQLAQAGQAQLVGLAQQTKVEPNPRFGTWDPVNLKVVSGEEASVVSTVQPAKTSRQQ
ncbi:hypothetical protein KIPE111705_35685 [Kibdelosporangium persicum]|uniref:PpiC-type peptidyl-prolyl cis-trans isomerase n=1 Tax=Kibdelosporangium persicum TaxID=2698649 RepID=A0ABX2F945_9PSEU|nr:hypothetical protein [Kibdelosporangium persicum]NRN67879.1 PpiC-type peptidyl-prolyl cis-trans isomerase [Kibdelosporangium persicum]